MNKIQLTLFNRASTAAEIDGVFVERLKILQNIFGFSLFYKQSAFNIYDGDALTLST